MVDFVLCPRQAQSRFAHSRKDLSQVDLQFLSGKDCKPDVVKILSAFIGLDDSVKVLPHKAGIARE